MNTRCPNCFHLLDGLHFAWTCVATCPPKLDEVASAFNGQTVESRPVIMMDRPVEARRSWKPPDDVPCVQCKGRTGEICPDCHYRLPTGWRQGTAVCIALAGARATGKSVYIGVLVKQLEFLAHMRGTSLSAADDLTRVNYTQHYEKWLFRERGILPPTASAATGDSHQRFPLIFTFGRRGAGSEYVVLRDVAGEDLEAGRSDLPHLAFFRHADAVFFLFDPLRVDAIREALHGVIPPQLYQGGDPVQVLDTVRAIIADGEPQLAVVLSKFDAMQELRRVDNPGWKLVMTNPGAAFARDPSLSNVGYDGLDGQLLHHEVRSLLHRLHAEGMVLRLENSNMGAPLPFRLFAVSALGTPPNGENQSGRGIASFRCLDPLKWVLSTRGVIPAET